MQITARGFLLLAVTAPLWAIGEWVTGFGAVTAAYLVLAIALLAIDWWQAQPVTRFEAERHHENRLSLGVENPIRLTIHNRYNRPTKLWVRDEPPDKYFEVSQRIFTGQVGSNRVWEETYYLLPSRRGDYEFGKLNLRWQGPLGLVIRQGVIDLALPFKVYPNLLDVRRYDMLLKRNRLQELGLRSVRQFGEGTEFERLRDYLPDDEYRRINWKATARRHRPVTVEYQTERSQNVMALMDIGRMMQSPVNNIAKLDYVVNAVLLFTYVATGKGDKVGVMTFADEVQKFVRPRQGRGQFYKVLELLYGVDAQPVEPNYQRALAYYSTRQRKRSLVVIFTDLSGGLTMQTLVTNVSLLARNNLVLVVTINDPDIVNASTQPASDSLAVYQRTAANQLLDQRKLVLDSLRRQGVLVLDVPANQLSISVVNRYLELKAKTLL